MTEPIVRLDVPQRQSLLAIVFLAFRTVRRRPRGACGRSAKVAADTVTHCRLLRRIAVSTADTNSNRSYISDGESSSNSSTTSAGNSGPNRDSNQR